MAAVVLFYACAVPIVFSGSANEGRAAADQLNYHEPVIHTFADQWPTPDLSNYHSATTPLYHWLLAGVEVAAEPSRRVLMLTGSVFTAGLLVLLVAGLPVGGRRALVLALPALASMYVFFPGVWLLPDNAGWLGVLAILLLALRGPMRGPVLVAAGTVLLALVLVRQIHLWAAGLIWAAAWLGGGADGPSGLREDDPLDPVGRVKDLFEDAPAALKRLMPALLVSLPAVVAVGYFYWLWDGFVVPRYQAHARGGYAGWNPATTAFHLSIVGSFVPFFGGYIRPGVARLVRTPAVLLGVVALGLLVAIVPETTYAAEEGRKSGLWNLVLQAPVLGGHTSVVVLALAPVGAVGIAALLSMIGPRRAWVYLGAFVGFVAAQTMSPQLWQRYHEPFILMMLALMSADAVRPGGPGWARVWRWAGPVVLAGGLAALSARTVLTDTPAVPLETGDFERSAAYEPIK